jgi:DNA-binding GntR family transcriptional regulator
MRRLMAAIRKRDGDAARLAASEHVQNAAEAALAQIDKADG